jgi:segregation and condensation protein B
MPEGTEPAPPPDDLGRSYAAALGDTAWQAEVPTDSPPAAEASYSESVAPPPPLRILEALLFVGGEPLTAKRASALVRGLSAEQFSQTIDSLNHDYRRQGRPYVIQAQGQGFILALRPRYRGVIEKVLGGVREARLSTAAIDVLALVAYRQPATKGEVDALRGAESGALLRQLVRRGLIQVVYRGDAEHKEVSYGTTPRFLELFGLQSLEDLPRTHDLQQL